MKIANFSVGRPVTILMLMIALIIIGGIAIPLLPVDLYPNLEIPTASVSVSWAGASPAQVEKQVVTPVEASMATIAGVTSVTSNSRNGAGTISVQFSYGTDINQAILTMRDRLDRVKRQLPTDADAPVVSRTDPNSQPIMSLAIYGDKDLITLRDITDNIVSPAIQRADGVGSVGVTGGRVRQIQVLLDPNKMQKYNLSLSTITSSLSNDNQSSDAGLVYKGQALVPLHIGADFKSTAEIGKTQVQVGRGQTIPLSELGQIVDTYQDVTLEARKDGQASVSMSILKQSDSNTVSVANNVRKMIDSLNGQLPEGVHVAVLNDTSKYISDSINTVVNHTLLGASFSVVILLLFLRSFRATLVIAIVIPISIVSTFSLMYFSHQSINTITLGGLALGLGSLVDFAVVVLESIFRKRHEGLDAEEAAKVGTKEVGTAVMASALAQIAVFLPTAFISGLVKQFFWPMALTVSFSHIAALFAAVTLVPMLSAKLMRGKIEEELPKGFSANPAVWFGHGVHWFTRAYGRFLSGALRMRWIVYIVTIALLAGSFYLYRGLGTELTPKTDEGQLNINISLPNGTAFDQTNALAAKIEDKLKDIPEIDTIFTNVGSQGGGAFQSSATNNASIAVTLKKDRKRSTDDIVEQIRTLTQGNPGAQINVNARSSGGLPGLGGGGGGGGSGISIDLSGPDISVLQSLGDMVANAVSDVPNIRSVQNTLDRSIPEFDLNIDRDAAAHFGVSVRDIMTSIRTAFQGAVGTNLKTGNQQIAVLVKYPNDFTNHVENLNQITITTTSGSQVQLSQVATVQPGSGPAQIRHTNLQRNASVTASVFGASVGEVSKQVEQVINSIQPPDGYTVKMGGQQTSMNQAFSSLGSMLLLSIVLVYMVMASQFESLYGPFIIMFSLPPTFVGAVLGLYLTHRTVNMNSIIGMIMLVGIVVNNAIVLIDYTNQLRKRGYSLRDALLEAGKIRLRPILMTTGTTVLAMLPLVIGFGEGAETQASMATVVSFGLTFSTLVTLVLVPCVYMTLDKWINILKRPFTRKPKSDAADATAAV